MARVYSTDQGRICPDCNQPKASCRCSQPGAPASDGIVRLQRQVKGRNGKPVTLITGIPLASKELKALAKELKNKCGVGGATEGDTILIQGDMRERIKAVLEARGYTVKLAGG